MKKQSVFAGKNIKLLKPYYDIGSIILEETGEMKNGKGKPLEFGKDYILVEGEAGDTLTRVYGEDDILLTHFRIESVIEPKSPRQKTVRRQMRRLYRKVFNKCQRRYMMRRFRRRKKLGLTFQNEANQ